MGIKRAESIARARKQIRTGVSANAWIMDMRSKGLGYTRTLMLRDYASTLQIEQKADTMKYIRKDRYPTEKYIASVSWELSKEFMYIVKVKSQITPDAPVTERKVNIQSDVPLTPRMVEAEVEEKWSQWEKYAPEIIKDIYVWGAVRKVIE